MISDGNSEARFRHMIDIESGVVSEPSVFAACPGKVLSLNSTTKQSTQLITISSGWNTQYSADIGALEIFVLKGKLIVDLKPVPSGSFVAIPMGVGKIEMRVEALTELFVIHSPHFLPLDYYDGKLYFSDNKDREWEVTEFPGELATNNQLHGVLSQSLRWPDPINNGCHGSMKGLLRLVCIAPGFIGDHRQESHPGCWEEIFWLTGDFFMPGTGRQAKGSHLVNPPGHIHGPLVSQRGCVMLVHTDSPAGFEFHEPPVERSIFENYLEQNSWLEEATHTRWSNCSEKVMFKTLTGYELDF